MKTIKQKLPTDLRGDACWEEKAWRPVESEGLCTQEVQARTGRVAGVPCAERP